jgi:hypothetical protein
MIVFRPSGILRRGWCCPCRLKVDRVSTDLTEVTLMGWPLPPSILASNGHDGRFKHRQQRARSDRIESRFPKLLLTHSLHSIEVAVSASKSRGIFALFFFGILGLQSIYGVYRPPYLLANQGRAYDAQEPRRPKTASIFTRFSIMRVRVHLIAPKGFVEITHAWRRENLW